MNATTNATEISQDMLDAARPAHGVVVPAAVKEVA